jgi:hypothetical protein
MEDSTLGGYLDIHRRPPAFEGSDGRMYSAEIYVDDQPCEDGTYGAAVLFVRWSPDGVRPDGHLETEYLAHRQTPYDARNALRRLTLYQVKSELDRIVEIKKELSSW